MRDAALAILEDQIARSRANLESWRQPSEPLLFETLRAIDYAICEELFTSPGTWSQAKKSQVGLSSWGVNKALSLILPIRLGAGAFRLFPSTGQTQSQASEFLLRCGILQRAEMLYGWLREGLLTARIDKPSAALPSGVQTVLVLKSEHPSMFGEIISQRSKRWVSDLTKEGDASWERDLQERHATLQAELEKSVGNFGGWGISYSTTREIDDHFLECGQIYLRRMWSQDLLGRDDNIGGEPFNHYLGVLAALAGRAEKHLCLSAILKRRHPELDLRNLLTTFAPCAEFVTGLAVHLDAETNQIRKLLEALTLGPDNLHVHTASAEMAWAPIVRSSQNSYILPSYGMDINPFLFLLTDLKAKFPKDWFRLANGRERRWLNDLKSIFPGNRWSLNDRNLKLRDEKKTVTDLDFIAYDKENNELAIFQLKWQHPVGMDNRARRSAGKNLLDQGNDWVERVLGWLGRYGVTELTKRAGIAVKPDVGVNLFVIGRYNAYFSGFSNRDTRAVWSDWNHFMKVRVENPRTSIGELASILKSEAEEIARSHPGDSYMFPLNEIVVILNPTSEP
jgi:hypothetical protein